jgi:hypothetical protein
MQYPNESTCKHTSEKRDGTFWTNACIIHLKHLQHIQHVQKSRSTFATSIWITCNISLKYLKHLKIHLQHALSALRNIFSLLGRMEARRHVEYIGGSSPAAAAVWRGKEAAPARLEEGARSAGEPLVPALPHWFAHDRGHRCRCAAMSRAAWAFLSLPAHAEAAAPACQDARPHPRERKGGGSSTGGTRERSDG